QSCADVFLRGVTFLSVASDAGNQNGILGQLIKVGVRQDRWENIAAHVQELHTDRSFEDVFQRLWKSNGLNAGFSIEVDLAVFDALWVTACFIPNFRDLRRSGHHKRLPAPRELARPDTVPEQMHGRRHVT